MGDATPPNPKPDDEEQQVRTWLRRLDPAHPTTRVLFEAALARRRVKVKHGA